MTPFLFPLTLPHSFDVRLQSGASNTDSDIGYSSTTDTGYTQDPYSNSTGTKICSGAHGHGTETLNTCTGSVGVSVWFVWEPRPTGAHLSANTCRC